MESQQQPKSDKALYVVTPEAPVSKLECEEAFNLVSDRERMYAYYMARASYQGALCGYFQRSFEAPALFYLLINVFKSDTMENLHQFALKELWFKELEWQ